MVERDKGGAPLYEDGKPVFRTAHSINPVPFVIRDFSGRSYELAPPPDAGLANLAATLLELLGYRPPDEFRAEPAAARGRVVNRGRWPCGEAALSALTAVFLTMALAGCGGGGGGSPRVVTPPVLFLPPGHGLGPGDITVAAGGLQEQGNVVVACPPGGNACVVRVSADGTAVYDRTGGVPSVTPLHEPWGLPPGHGLDLGDITVAAGVSREQGNVVVACPPGGNACVVRVSADGTTSYAVTGGVPTFAYVHPTHEMDNPSAQDVMDHWNEPEQLRAPLGLSSVDPARVEELRGDLSKLIRMAGGNSAETGTKTAQRRSRRRREDRDHRRARRDRLRQVDGRSGGNA